ncbi:MAG: hypothetical protein Q8O16_07895 [Dehalococcoidia bacterium]|nr:hypothetical protein [Dehalococcoidia bacterium]
MSFRDASSGSRLFVAVQEQAWALAPVPELVRVLEQVQVPGRVLRSALAREPVPGLELEPHTLPER